MRKVTPYIKNWGFWVVVLEPVVVIDWFAVVRVEIIVDLNVVDVNFVDLIVVGVDFVDVFEEVIVGLVEYEVFEIVVDVVNWFDKFSSIQSEKAKTLV